MAIAPSCFDYKSVSHWVICSWLTSERCFKRRGKREEKENKAVRWERAGRSGDRSAGKLSNAEGGRTSCGWCGTTVWCFVGITGWFSKLVELFLGPVVTRRDFAWYWRHVMILFSFTQVKTVRSSAPLYQRDPLLLIVSVTGERPLNMNTHLHCCVCWLVPNHPGSVCLQYFFQKHSCLN